MEENTKTRIRFLHCSDIHLDTPFVGISAEKSEERRRMLRASFVKMMQYIRETNVNIVLMSGDIFNTEYATNTTAEVLIREFKALIGNIYAIATAAVFSVASGILFIYNNLTLTYPSIDAVVATMSIVSAILNMTFKAIVCNS